MPTPSTTDEFLGLLEKSDLVPASRLREYLDPRRAEGTLPADPLKLARDLVLDGVVTKYQAEQLLAGRWRNFILAGKYRLMERLGKGGMALVFLCEHLVMRRLVAVKILPTAHGEDPELLGRFHREARALSQLRHPNIVGAYDVNQAQKVHFLVMEYIDGGDLDVIVQKAGPLAYERAADYIRQAAHGLQHAHECGLVHRDVKPGNLLVDRAGTVKLLDLGLARIFHESNDELTTGREAGTLLGTVDYLAPEQALDSHDVDIRADIYSLGATFYFLLTGKGLFEGGTVAQKLSWHFHRPPVPLASIRPDLPAELVGVIEKMLAKDPADRFQTPDEVEQALGPWVGEASYPPAPEELPSLSKAARGSGQPSSLYRPSVRTPLPNQVRTAEAPDSGLSTNPSVPSPGPPATRGPARRKPAALVATLLVVVGGASWYATVSGDGRALAPDARIDAAPVRRGPGRALDAGIDREPVAADGRFWLASGTNPPRSYPTLREAIRAARSGDMVTVRGGRMVAALELSDVGGAPDELTLVGEDPSTNGGPVRWLGPANLAPGRALLDVSGLAGFRLRGFVFDGQGRVPELVRLSGRAAGSSFEEVGFEGAGQVGVVVRGWFGEPLRPARFRSARFSTDEEIEAAVSFEGDPDRPALASESIQFEDCRFDGPFHAAVSLAGPVAGLDIERCRFHRATDAILYRKSGAREPIRARLADNRFSDLERGIHFETTPPALASGLEVINNRFSNTFRLASLDRVPVQPTEVAGRWIWTEEGRASPVVPAGVRYFRKVFDLGAAPEAARLDIGSDDQFTAWINGREVGRSPSDHDAQRVHAFVVTEALRTGPNVLAVRVTNRPDRSDPRAGSTAGLLAQITARDGDRESIGVRTDDTWKASDRETEGWNRVEFDDASWGPAHPWPESGPERPWRYMVWDSAVDLGIKPPLEPIRVTASGNVRDDRSWEGYPALDSERVVGLVGTPPSESRQDVRSPRDAESGPLSDDRLGGPTVGLGRPR